MGNRTLIEINHDYAGRIGDDGPALLRALRTYLGSGDKESALKLDRWGIRVFGMRHHSDAFEISWAGKKITEKESAKW